MPYAAGAAVAQSKVELENGAATTAATAAPPQQSAMLADFGNISAAALRPLR